jgi:hypothetical protein
MNADVFHTWIEEEVLPRIFARHGENAVIVLDQATYHRVATDDTKRVWKTAKKQEIKEWIVAQGGNIAHLEGLVVEGALSCERIAPPVKYKIVEMGEAL